MLKMCATLLVVFMFSLNSFSREYKLSRRTVREFRQFQEIQNDMADMQSLANVILGIAPFRSLLDGVDILDAVEISQEPWDLIGEASKGLASHYRDQLKLFCEMEALSQHKSRDDYLFWTNLAKQFK